MAYTMYTPLNVWLDPASVTDVVAYIQNYLSENTIYSEEEIEELIHDYLEAHPELIGGVQSVNGKTGTVVLSASDINTANNVTIESVLASLSSQISSIASSVATNTTNITNLTGRVTTAETDLSNLKSSLDMHFDIISTNLMTLDTKENIYPGAADWDGTWSSNDLSANTFDGSTFHGYPVLICTGSWKRSLYKILNAEAGKTYTFGCWVKAADASDIRLNSKYSGLTATLSSQTIVAPNVPNNTWTWIQYTFDCTGSGTFAPYVTTSKNTTLYIAEYILVESNSIFSNKVFRCEKNGSGDFSSFVDAVNEAIKYKDSTVFVGAGEWDIISELGATYMSNVSSSSNTWGLVLKNNIHIIGSSKTIIKAVNTSDSSNFDNIKQYFSIFNAGGNGGFTLENLTLYDENIRYSVHDDLGGSGSTPYINKYINCTMIHKNGIYSDCIGGGIGENCTVEICGCYFEGDSGRPRLAYYHGNNNSSVSNAQAHIIVCDNYFAQDGTFQLTNYGNSTTVSKAFVSNNSFGTAPSVTDGSSPSPIIVNMELVEWNNEVRT